MPRTTRFVDYRAGQCGATATITVTEAHIVAFGIGPQTNPELADPLARERPLLAELYGASVSGRIATGPRAGRRITTLGDRVEVETSELEQDGDARCATVSGVSLHAEVCVPGRERFKLERLCRLC